MATEPDVRVRRVYEPVSPDDGERLLVDRLWPRGLSKQAAHLDAWAKDVAPSNELRRWYGHQPARFAEFRRRYADELREPERAKALAQLNEAARHGTVTLLTATKDAAHSEAAVLAEQLRAGRPARQARHSRARTGTGPKRTTCRATRRAGCTGSARPAARSRTPILPPPARSAAPRSPASEAADHGERRPFTVCPQRHVPDV